MTITGGEGHGSGNARWLVVMQPMRAKAEGETKQTTFQLLDSDVREAMALAARRLNDEAMKYSAQGFTWDLETIGYAIGSSRTISATLRIARDGS